MKQKINSVYGFTVENFGRHFENRCDVILAVMSPLGDAPSLKKHRNRVTIPNYHAPQIQ